MSVRNYTNAVASTTTTVVLTSGTLSFTVASATGFPATPFVAVLGFGSVSAEVVLVTGVAGTTFTVTRGYDGTTAVSHLSGETVDFGITKIEFSEANAHVNAVTAVHGLVGAPAGVTDTQTLTNKTISKGTYTGDSGTPAIIAKDTSAGSGKVFSGRNSVNTEIASIDQAGVLSTQSDANIGGNANVTAAMNSVTAAVSGAMTVGSLTANTNGAVTGVLVPKSYSNESVATTALGSPPNGTTIWLTTPTTAGYTAGLYSWTGFLWVPTNPNKLPYLQARQTTVQAIGAASATTLTNYTADFTGDGGFSTSTGVWTCGVTGTYEAWGVVALVPGAARNGALLLKNGATVLTQGDTGAGSGVITATIPPFRVAMTAVTDTLELQAYVTTGVNTSVAAGAQSFFAVKRIT